VHWIIHRRDALYTLYFVLGRFRVGRAHPCNGQSNPGFIPFSPPPSHGADNLTAESISISSTKKRTVRPTPSHLSRRAHLCTYRGYTKCYRSEESSSTMWWEGESCKNLFPDEILLCPLKKHDAVTCIKHQVIQQSSEKSNLAAVLLLCTIARV